MSVHLINVEKSKFIEGNIDIYSANKVGQYSKFLDKNQVFVTYYSVNEALSTVDAGTGNIDSLFGEFSPIRYNKIKNLPVYNIPELKPDYDINTEDGVTTRMEISDITILPNTVHPKPYDCMLVSIKGAVEVLFQINNFQYNTIQSNDYYSTSFTMYAMGEHLEEKYLKKQIVETYETVFENIGTQDKCFIRTNDVEKINTLVRVIDTLKEDYLHKFYDELTNAFLLRKNEFEFKCRVKKPNKRIKIKDVEQVFEEEVIEKHLITFRESLYDPYLEKFIMDTRILESNNSEYTLVLVPNDVLSSDFSVSYSHSIWDALIKGNTLLLSRYMYFYQSKVVKDSSPFIVYGIEANTVYLTASERDKFMLPEVERKLVHAKRVGRINEIYQSYDLSNYDAEHKKELKRIRDKVEIAMLKYPTEQEANTLILKMKDDLDAVKTLEDDIIMKNLILLKNIRDEMLKSNVGLSAKKKMRIQSKFIETAKLLQSAPIEILGTVLETFRYDLYDIVEEDSK